ncbi:leucyl aminopeptidase family protein [Chryseobacterium sp. cx-311]|uniref:leucyl aminopeptidase family protein n=1 Tax=Marnyiella aurantia TaxID=2758037 RepID=UPI001AE54044|nr:leucyl aminopeptidase family protein [Marnyiella aurantia]MBP0612727.1 leucyl aminopeptidase family protein [Marnyiella aurantia]
MHINIKSFAEQKNISQHFIFTTEKDWKELGATYRKSTGDQFTGKKGETFITVNQDDVKFFIGLGDDPKDFDIQETAAKFSWNFRKKIKPQTTNLICMNSMGENLKPILTGLYLGTYEYPFESKHPFFTEGFELIAETDAGALEAVAFEAKALCEGEFACREWLNKPQNHQKVHHLTKFLSETSEKYGFKKSVFNREECEKLGLGAFLSVNQGSAQDCAFTIMEYNCGNLEAKTVGLVGKCVLFDTGGISIKSSDNLHYMKSDMGGATAVIGAMITAAERKLPVNIIAVLPITDNAVSASAYVPSDVVRAYNGKTIEVINTDAEGRMTLADGLSYLADNYKTDIMIDLATLTGSSVRMFGGTCGALFTNDQALGNQLQAVGDRSNQRLWNMPMWDIWNEDFKSDVADFKNISLKPVGDCIVAAKFLEQFIGGHPRWAHLDIAGVAFGPVPYAKEKAATGYGVQLLINFMENMN